MQRKSNYNTPILKNMGSNMKTTLDLSDALFLQAKELAREQGLTFRSLVEEGLRHVLDQLKPTEQPTFVLKDMSFHGGSQQAPIDFSQLREIANERPNTNGVSW
jgi:hypothetical protein